MKSTIIIAAALGLLLAGCNGGGTSSTSTSPEPSGGSKPETPAARGPKLRLAFVTNNSSDFWTIARKGVEKAEAELGDVEVNFQLPGDGQAAEQKRIVDDLLAKGLDGMAISPVDPKNQKDMLDEVAGKTLLITQDSDAPASKRACYVGTDNVAAGRMAGQELLKALPNGGKVMAFVGMADAQNAKERFQGIKEAIKGSKIEIVDLRTDLTDRVKAKANVADALVKIPDLAGLVGLWSYNGPAILNAVKEADKVGKVKIVCFDEEDDTLAGTEAGEIDATIVQQPFEFGYQSVKLMEKIKKGDKSAIPASKQIFVETRVINKANVVEFKAELKKLRGK